MSRQHRDEKVDWVQPPEPVKRRQGRPRKCDLPPEIEVTGEPVRTKADLAAEAFDPVGGVRPASILGGVNVAWLSTAFNIDSRTTRKRLAGLKPKGIGKHNSEVYDFVEASSYLAPPQPDKFARWMSNLRTSDLPVQLQDTYWSAMRKRQIWEQNAGDLWKTEDVEDVLGEVFKTLKSTMQLWVDNLDAKGDMAEEQRNTLTHMVDGLQAELYRALVQMPKERRTKSSLHDPEVVTNAVPVGEDDDDEDLIG